MTLADRSAIIARRRQAIVASLHRPVGIDPNASHRLYGAIVGEAVSLSA